MNDNIEDWIHDRVELETTDGGDIIIKPKPVEGEPPPTGSILIDSRGKVLVNHGDIPGPNQLALDLGVRRALYIGKVVGGTALIAGGGLMAKGVPWQLALPAAGLMAVGSALTTGVKKTNKEIDKLPGAAQVSNWIILARIILEVLKLIRELMKMLKERASRNGKSSAGSLSK